MISFRLDSLLKINVRVVIQHEKVKVITFLRSEMEPNSINQCHTGECRRHGYLGFCASQRTNQKPPDTTRICPSGSCQVFFIHDY